MIVINFFGAPCAGKSTSAAYAFAFLKNKGINVELVTEYAKEMVYSNRTTEMSNQIYMTAKQYKKMKDIMDYGVPVIVTDSPILLGTVYSRHMSYYKELEGLSRKLHEEFDNINILLSRAKPYSRSGRNQTEEESDKIFLEVSRLVDFDFFSRGDEKGQRLICEDIYIEIKNRLNL